jgi:hypothetical protein
VSHARPFNSILDAPSCQAARDQSVTVPLLVWLALQLIALALAAARVPFSANFIRPAEVWAVQEMLIVQFVALATLFPFLLRDMRCCLALILASGPMLELAAMLAGTPMTRVIGAWGCLAIWLTGLAAWRAATPSRLHPIAIALANLLTLGGFVFEYLGHEFHLAPPAMGAPPAIGLLPLPATLRFAADGAPFFLPLLSTAILALLGVISLTAQRRRGDRQ